MKRNAVLFVGLLSISIFSMTRAHEANRYVDYATHWCAQVMQANPSEEEKTLLLNLAYWSRERSTTVLTLQKAVVEYMKCSGMMVNDAMSARLNPAQMSSILHYSTAQWERNCALFDRAHKMMRKELERYRFVAATYAHCLEYLIKEADLRYEIKELITSIRENSRTVRMQVMQEQLTSITSLMENMKKIMGSLNFQTRGFDDSSRGFMDCIIQFANPGVFSSFAKFDKNYNTFNAKAWQTLTSSYALSNVLWEMTEVVRVHFYAEHYVLLVQMLGCRIDQQHLLKTAFNADGFVEAGNRVEFLTA